jgi:recombination protein RecA
MDIRRIGQIKESSGKVIGNRTRLKVVKNKVAPPFTECEFDIMFSEGISQTGSLLDLGIEHKILEKKGAWISYDGELLGQGREAAKQALLDDSEKRDEIQRKILDKVQVSVGSVLAGAEGEEESGNAAG